MAGGINEFFTTYSKTAVAMAVAGTLAGAGIQAAEADVVNLSWKGAFTMLAPLSPVYGTYGSVLQNTPSDYASGYYALPGPASGPATTHGWYGIRTPITGTMSFDTNSGAGVAAITPFLFLSNSSTRYANMLGVTFHTVDTVGTLVGSMLFSWGLGSHQVSIVMDAGQLLAALPSIVGGAPSTNYSGTYTAYSNTAPLMTAAGQITTAIARTSTLNTASGCDALTLATQVNAYTINTNFANLATCTNTSNGYGDDDGVAGDPMTSPSFHNHNINFDILSVHLTSFTPTPQEAVPLPAPVWLFGSGLLGFIGIMRRKKTF